MCAAFILHRSINRSIQPSTRTRPSVDPLRLIDRIESIPFTLRTQLTFKLSLLPNAMEDMGGHVQARLNGLLMKCVPLLYILSG